MTNYEEQKEERMKKNKQSLKDLWYTIKSTYIGLMEVLKGKGRKRDRTFKEITMENVLILIKYINIHI